MTMDHFDRSQALLAERGQVVARSLVVLDARARHEKSTDVGCGLIDDFEATLSVNLALR